MEHSAFLDPNGRGTPGGNLGGTPENTWSNEAPRRAEALAPRKAECFHPFSCPRAGTETPLKHRAGRRERLPHLWTGESACPTFVSSRFVARRAPAPLA